VRVDIFTDCGDKICENGGSMDPGSCKCKCEAPFTGDTCGKGKLIKAVWLILKIKDPSSFLQAISQAVIHKPLWHKAISRIITNLSGRNLNLGPHLLPVPKYKCA